MTIREATTRLTTPDGISLFSRVWRPKTEKTPHAMLAVIHGQGEHSGRYQKFADYFVSRGYAVYACDLRGHGQSDGQHGHVDRFDDYNTDVRTLLDFMQEDFPTSPIFLVGHSLGGLIVLNYAIRYPQSLTGVISSGAALCLKMIVPQWKLTLARLSSGLVPRLTQPNGLETNALSRDDSVVTAYRSDPLVHDRVTARWGTEFLEAQDATLQNAPHLLLPCLILHGGEDRLCDASASRDFFESVGASDKHHVEYAGLYHEIFNEPEKEQVFADIDTWVQAKI